MSTTSVATDITAAKSTKLGAVLSWIPRLAVAVIFTMGALPKFLNYTPEGTMVLAEALGVGRGVITLMGLVELTAVVLIMIPSTRIFGALLAAVTMAGALFAHATKIGWSGSAVADMWPLALIALAAATFELATARRRS